MTGHDSTTGHRSSRMSGVSRTIAWTLLVVVIFDAILILVFRLHWKPAIEAIRRFNKKILNPAMMRYAGKPHWYASVVHHTGRKSGNSYATPIWAVPSGEFFYIPLPYGTDVDWCKNILKAGTCTVESDGIVYETTAPSVVSAEIAAGDLPFRPRTRFSVYGVENYLRLRKETQPVVVAMTG